MSLSSDGGTLFVGLDGSGEVAQVNLQSQSVSYATSLFNPSLGPRFAQYLSANPASSGMVAVSLNSTVAILDNGTLLPNVSDSPFNSINSIAFDNSGNNLYGYDNVDSGFDFYRLSVNSSGVSLVNEYGRLFYGFSATIQNHDGLIYSSNGTVVNPGVPALQGQYLPYSSPAVSGFFDDTTKEAYFLEYAPAKTPANSVLRFNLSNYSFLDSTPISGLQGQGWT